MLVLLGPGWDSMWDSIRTCQQSLICGSEAVVGGRASTVDTHHPFNVCMGSTAPMKPLALVEQRQQGLAVRSDRSALTATAAPLGPAATATPTAPAAPGAPAASVPTTAPPVPREKLAPEAPTLSTRRARSVRDICGACSVWRLSNFR